MAQAGDCATDDGAGLRDGLNACNLCGVMENLSLCSGCRGIWYCSKAHQREDWGYHKQTCKKNGKLNNTRNREDKSTKLDKDLFRVKSRPSSETTPHTEFKNSNKDTVNDRLIKDSSSLDELLNPLSLESDQTTKTTPKSSSLSHASMVQESTEVLNHFSGQTTIPKDSVSESEQQSEKDMVTSGHTPTTITNLVNKKTARSKKKSKRDKASLPPISEDGSPAERYYLNNSTHRLKLPSALKKQWLNHKGSSPNGGVEEKHMSAKQIKEQYLSILWARFQELAAYVVECLTKYGICVIDKFLGEATGQEILNEVLQIKETGILRQGQLVHGPTSSSNKYIRGDMITWVDGLQQGSENIHYLVSCMDAVLIHCDSKLKDCTINERTKAMVACYPGHKTKYVRHVDNPNGDGRCITCIYYLNKSWDVKQHGGLLRIYPEGSDQVANIEPKFDRLLFFWSDRRNPHEVEQAFVERYAITVWYYDAEERAEALKRFKIESELAGLKKSSQPSSPLENEQQ